MHPVLAHLLQKEVPPVFLLYGDDTSFLLQEAEAFARALLKTDKTYPADLMILSPEGKTEQHTLENIKLLLDKVPFPPYESPYKIFILDQADRMTYALSNALLKTLEEPPLGSLFILTAQKPSLLPKTLLSRLQKFSLEKSLLYEPYEPWVLILKEIPKVPFGLLQEKVQELKFEEDKKSLKRLLWTHLSFFRDLYWFEKGVEKLQFPQYRAYYQSLLSLPLSSLDDLYQEVQRADLALERSTRPQVFLEALLLQLYLCFVK